MKTQRTCRWLTILALSGLAGLAVQAGDGASETKVKVSVQAGKIDDAGNQTIAVNIAVDPDWHIYANPVDLPSMERSATVLKLATESTGKLLKVAYPPGVKYTAKNGDVMLVYKGKVAVQAIVQRASNEPAPVLALQVYACNDNVCLPKGIVELPLK